MNYLLSKKRKVTNVVRPTKQAKTQHKTKALSSKSTGIYLALIPDLKEIK